MGGKSWSLRMWEFPLDLTMHMIALNMFEQQIKAEYVFVQYNFVNNKIYSSSSPNNEQWT